VAASQGTQVSEPSELDAPLRLGLRPPPWEPSFFYLQPTSAFYYIITKVQSTQHGANKNRILCPFRSVGVLCLLVEFFLSCHVDKTQP
jgi:hypothetical protein